jgi:hypothetical protein
MHDRRVSLTARPRRAWIVLLACACLAALALGAQPSTAQEDGVGSVSARGTDPGAFWSPVGEIEAQLSAITNCDAAQSTRPFIVRWSAGGTTYTFRKTSVDKSSCFSDGFPESARYDTVNKGDGQGTVNGSPATLSWRFTEGDASGLPEGVSNDHAFVEIILKSGEHLRLHIANPEGDDQSLNGTPGGVWAFGQLPWPRPEQGNGVASPPAANAPTVSAFDSLATIRSDQALPPGGGRSVHISAAGNEFESFQIAVQAGSAPLGGVRVGPGQTLAGPDGATIPASSLMVYREVDYRVSRRSDAEGATGSWPDALTPERDAYYGEDRNAFPVDLAAGQRLAAWIDVLVPDGAPAGDYTGSIEVVGGGRPVAEIPVRVTVHGFSIPSTSTLRSAFQIDDVTLAGGDQTLYAVAALNNRVTLANLWPFPESRFVAKILPLLEGTDPRLLLPGAKLTALDSYHCATNCLAPWRDLAQKYPIVASRFFDYICDEPSTPEAWNDCNATAASAESIWPGVRKLVTTDIANTPSWATDLSPLVNDIDRDGPAAYGAWQRAGAHRSLWPYTSCRSFSCDGSESSEYSGWPGYAIDQPASQARAMGWLAYITGATGELYWNTTVSLPHAWTNQYVAGGNGDGNLFYPGTPGVVGGTHPIPIESMRLKRIRDGREDYEYLRILAARGQRSTATEVVTELFGSPSVAMHSTSVDPAALNEARRQLAALIAG